jgi:hypothetical protein
LKNPLKRFNQVWAVDTEYIARPGERPIPVCLSAYEYRSRRKILLWQDQLGSEPPFDISSDSLFVTFYAPAELGFFRAIGWQQPALVLDLFAEYKNRLNGYCNPRGYSLVAALAHHGLDHIDAGEKEDMRNLILRGGPWSAKEKAGILAYCQSDTDALARLLPRMWPHIDFYRAVLRGRYMKAVSAMEYTGVPIDVELYARLNSNWERIQERLIQKVDAQYHVYEGRSFRVELFERYLRRNNMGWPRLDSGNPKLDDDTFEEMAHIFPQVANLRKLRQALGEMRLSDLAVGFDGFNRCMLSPFASRTGRNQPSNTKFIFGPGSWLRGLIKPKKGFGVAYTDYSQQEFAIAAALSGDRNMQQAYLSGDPYLAFAKLAGAVPEDATKKTHSEQRNLYKTCVLGTQYGMEQHSLSKRIQPATDRCPGTAATHREVFRVFWKWSDNKTDSAQYSGRPANGFWLDQSCLHQVQRAIGTQFPDAGEWR